MSRQIEQLIQEQPQVRVIAQTHNTNDLWFKTLVAMSAGVFYFFGYYFWGDSVWSTLTGG
jgi:hypothetical protein